MFFYYNIELFFFNLIFNLNFFFYDLIFNFLNIINPYTLNSIFFLLNNINYQFPQNLIFFFTLKFMICIGFLILIRGGTPRYRYDFLTKLGWLKFLGLIIFLFLNSIFFYFLF